MPGKNRKSDPKKVLEAETFDFKETKDGKVLLYHQGRQIEVLTGPEAEKFLKRAKGADHKALQLLMARATKNFKRGNERAGKR